jgi:peptide subunit release factor 1 (eRF1)
VIQLNDIKRLLATSNGGDILSLYLRVDPALQENQAEKPAWSIYVKNAFKKIDFDEYGTARETWQAIRDRAEDYLKQYTPSSKGLALFYGEELQQIYELPVPPLKNATHFGKMQVAPLLWLMDEYERYLVVLVGTDEARFLTTYMGDIGREETMASDRLEFDFSEKTLMPRPSGPDSGGGQVTAGSHRDRFDDMMNEYIDRFHTDVAERIRKMMKETGAKRLILGGGEKAAHAVKDKLHQSVAKLLVGIASVPLQENDKIVMERVAPMAIQYERARELDLVQEIKGVALAGGHAALGYDAVKNALELQQAETLIAAYPPLDEAKLHELTIKTLESGGDVQLVHSDAAKELDDFEGFAARLYYVIPEQAQG